MLEGVLNQLSVLYSLPSISTVEPAGAGAGACCVAGLVTEVLVSLGWSWS